MAEQLKKKRRLRRRIGWSLLILFIAALIGHGIWGLAEKNSLAKQIAALQRAGEPILPADFASADADGPNNAILDLRAAGDGIDSESRIWETISDPNLGLPLRDTERQVIDAAVQQCAPAFKSIERARGKSKLEWSLNLSNTRPIDAMLPSFNGMRDLASLFGAAALIDHERGDDASALRRIDDIIFFGNAVDRYPSLVGHLVAIGCRALACARMIEIMPDLRIGNQPGEVSPDDVQRMINRLLNDEPLRIGYTRGLQGERMLQLAIVQGIATGPISITGSVQQPTIWNRLAQYATMPIVYHNAKLMLEQASAIIPLGKEPNWPAAKRKFPPRIEEPILISFLARMFAPSERRVSAQFRMLTDQCLTAVVLALRWYVVDHAGQLPLNLSELVPKYLPAVPIDLFAADGREISYHGVGSDPIVYSIGEDGTDDGGSYESKSKYRINPNEWETKDRVVHLTRQPRPAPEHDDSAESPAPPLSVQSSQP